MIPAGSYFTGSGKLAECPQGTYKEETSTATEDAPCTPCGTGITTEASGATSPTDCKVLLAGYAAETVPTTPSTYITKAFPCPQKFYCPGGGVATKAYAIDDDTTYGGKDAAVNSGAYACPNKLWTENTGAIAEAECCKCVDCLCTLFTCLL